MPYFLHLQVTGGNDSDDIGQWSHWQGYLYADIMVVGQDWGDVAYFKKWKGFDPPSGNPTNTKLKALLLKHFDIDIQCPSDERDHQIFITNIILCLKNGGMQAPVNPSWLSDCAKEFFKPLVEIVQPQIILALGQNVSETILKLYGTFDKNYKYLSLSELMEKAPFNLTETTSLFPLYHCGNRGEKLNRSPSEQNDDWHRVAEWYRIHRCDSNFLQRPKC